MSGKTTLEVYAYSIIICFGFGQDHDYFSTILWILFFFFLIVSRLCEKSVGLCLSHLFRHPHFLREQSWRWPLIIIITTTTLSNTATRAAT